MSALGAPGGGTGRRAEDEDEEHTRKTWLEEPDADELFGTDQPAVRPVLGEE